MWRYGETYSSYAPYKKSRIINNVGYLENTNSLFLKSHSLKLSDMVQFKTAQIMFKARNQLLPGNIQKLFMDRRGGYNFGGELNKKNAISEQLLKVCALYIDVMVNMKFCFPPDAFNLPAFFFLGCYRSSFPPGCLLLSRSRFNLIRGNYINDFQHFQMKVFHKIISRTRVERFCSWEELSLSEWLHCYFVPAMFQLKTYNSV